MNTNHTLQQPPADTPTADWQPPDDNAAELRWQSVLLDINRRMVGPAEIAELMTDALRMAAETIGGEMFSIAELRPDGRSMGFRFFQLVDGEISEPQECILPVDPARSLSGCAIQVGQPLVISQLGQKDAIDPFLKKQGVGSAVVCPLQHQNQSFGAVGVYCLQANQFEERDATICEMIAGLLSMNLARQSAEERLCEQQRLSEAVLETLESPVMLFSVDGRVQQMNRAASAISGFAAEELRGRPLWSALLIPEEMIIMKQALDRLKLGETPVRVESFILTKHGERRRIAWCFTTLRDEQGIVESLVGAGADITRQNEMLEELERLHTENRTARAALSDLQKKIATGEILIEGHGDERGDEDDPYRERRHISRRPYPYLQFTAPIINGKLPEAVEFEEVRCRDISARGFAYLSPSEPLHKRIVVAFGARPSIVYLTAEIRHTTRVTVDGVPMFLVGCAYTGRAEY